MPVITACGAVVLTLMFVYGVVNRSVRNFIGDGDHLAPVSDVASGNRPVPASQGWQTFQSDEGGFEVDLPGKLDLAPSPAHAQTLPDNSGQVTADMPQGGSLTVAWTRGTVPWQSGKTPRDLLNGVRDGLTSAVQGTIQSDHPLDLQGHPGSEFLIWGTIQGRPATMAVRIYIVGRDFYQLNWVNSGYRATASNDARRVFESFRLTRSN